MARRGPRLTKSTWIVLALLLPVGYLTANLFRKWYGTQQGLRQTRAEYEALSGRNAALARAYEVLQNRKFQICNKSPHPLRVDWVAAAYGEGRQLKVFDSSRCSGWPDLEIASGENKSLLLSSSEEGCNWSGNVLYYAMRFSKETDEASVPFSLAGIYRGFDRDCFTVQ